MSHGQNSCGLWPQFRLNGIIVMVSKDPYYNNRGPFDLVYIMESLECSAARFA